MKKKIPKGWAATKRVKCPHLRLAIQAALNRLPLDHQTPIHLPDIFEVDLPPGSAWDGDSGAIYFSAENLETLCGFNSDLWAEEVTGAICCWLQTFGEVSAPSDSD